MAEACDTFIREKHPASPPKLPKDTGTPAQGDQGWPGETQIIQEPPNPRRKTASTPRPERGGSPMRAEQGPGQVMFSPSPVTRKEKTSALRTHVPETEESRSDGSDEPEDKRGRREERNHPVAWPTTATIIFAQLVGEDLNRYAYAENMTPETQAMFDRAITQINLEIVGINKRNPWLARQIHRYIGGNEYDA